MEPPKLDIKIIKNISETDKLIEIIDSYTIQIYQKDEADDGQLQQQLLCMVQTPFMYTTNGILCEDVMEILSKHEFSSAASYKTVSINSTKEYKIWLKIPKIEYFLIIIDQNQHKIVSEQFFGNLHPIHEHNQDYFYIFGVVDLQGHSVQCTYLQDATTHNISILQAQNVISSCSSLEIKSKIKKFVNQTQYSKRSTRSHQQLVLNNQIILIVQNLETLIYNVMASQIHNIHEFYCKLSKIYALQRTKRPINYYTQIYEGLKKSDLPYQNDVLVRLVQYCLIQNIQIQRVVSKVHKTLDENIQQQRENLETSIKKLMQIDPQILQFDFTCPTVIFYWAIGLHQFEPIFLQLHKKLSVLGAKSITICFSNSNADQQSIKNLNLFIKDQNLFYKDRFAYVFITDSFWEEQLSRTVQVIEDILPQNYNYEVLLICPEQQPHQFTQSDLLYDNNYYFSLDQIISVILQTQKQPDLQQNSNSIQNLSKILHLISSRYCNLNMLKLMDEQFGNTRILRYPKIAYINWNQYEIQYKEEIEDSLRILLESSYKSSVSDDPLLWYFEESIEQIAYEIRMENVTDILISQTFSTLPYLDFFQQS